MAATCLLDSGIIIDALNGKRGRRELIDQLIQDGADMACCSINVTEVYAGLRPGEEAKTGRLLRSLKFYPVTWEIAKQAGGLLNVWRQQNRTLSLELDAMATKAYLPSTKSSLNPYSYGWFSIIALSRIHGIHFHKTKKARAALRDVKRKPRQPQPEQIDLPDIAALAKQKAMR